MSCVRVLAKRVGFLRWLPESWLWHATKIHDIFEGTEQIQQLVISRAISGLRIEWPLSWGDAALTVRCCGLVSCVAAVPDVEFVIQNGGFVVQAAREAFLTVVAQPPGR